MRKTREESLENALPRSDSQTSMDASIKYTTMLLEADEIPRWHNILAGLSTWIILASYIVFPSTFSKFQKNKKLEEMKEDNNNNLTEIKLKALRAVR
jgi:hypothetical protein